MEKIFAKKYLVALLSIAIFAYFCFWWLFRLGVLPGLHGDEAWVGLMAHDYQVSGVNQFTGMTDYTGILQTLIAELSFNLFGIGVYQLRLPGAIINLASLVMATVYLIKYRAYKQTVIFLLFMGASTLLLTSPRIAWEVNSFTLFFITVSMISFIELFKANPRFVKFWVWLFLVANLLGTYNHVIFSCMPVSALCGLFLWSNYNKSNKYKNLICLLAVNFVNVCLIFLLMRYGFNLLDIHLGYIPLMLVLYISGVAQAYYRLTKFQLNYSNLVPPHLVHGVLIVFAMAFTYFHGPALFETLCGYKVILQLYSYESSLVFKIVYSLCAATIVFYLTKSLLADLLSSESSLPAFLILTYLGIFCCYTIKGSFRYYLTICIILSLYMAFKLATNRSNRRPIIASLLMTMLLLNAQMLHIVLGSPIPVKALDFKLGSSLIETSAHFLPKEPLIQFLRKEKIGSINYLVYPYFIEQPIRFYELFVPWQAFPQNQATIDYDYYKYHSGFQLKKLK